MSTFSFSIQQLQPRFLQLRNIYESRERNSKIYSWFAFTCAAIVPECEYSPSYVVSVTLADSRCAFSDPWSFVAGTLYWCCWYWATWFPRGTYPAASMWLLVCVFEVFYVSFGQAIASFAPNELLASILVPMFFLYAKLMSSSPTHIMEHLLTSTDSSCHSVASWCPTPRSQRKLSQANVVAILLTCCLDSGSRGCIGLR